MIPESVFKAKKGEKLSEYQKEILAVMLDWGAVGDKKVKQEDVLNEVDRRLANKYSGMSV